MRSLRPSYLIAPALAALVCALPLAGATRRRVVTPPDTSHFCDLGTDVPGVTVPPELCIRKFADVPTPRVLLFAPNGDLFVASPRRITPGGAPAGAGAIFLFRQTDTTQPPTRFTFNADPSLESVHGILISGNTFFYTLAVGVYSVPYVAGSTVMSGTPQQIANLGTNIPSARWTHSLAAASDGSILVSSGQVDNSTCPISDPHAGGVFRVGGSHPAGGDVVADGLRDPLYIRCMPWGSCYGAELSGDIWEGPPYNGTEKLIELHDGDHYGYPCCIDTARVNPDLKPVPDCSHIVPSKSTFPLHNTPFGFDWERDFGWPDPYRGAFFVGLHGRFGSWTNAGLQWAPTDPTTHLPTRTTTDFALGFGRTGAISRVGDVLFAPDGRLFFADDQDGAIFWIAPRTLKRP